MEKLTIGDKINIRRSDGCIQTAIVGLKSIDRQIVTVEWTEGSKCKGKEIPWSVVVELNAYLVKEEPQPMETKPELPKSEAKPNYSMYSKKVNSPYKKSQCVGNRREVVAAKQEPVKQTVKPPAPVNFGYNSSRNLNPDKKMLNTPRATSNVVREVERLKEQREQRRAVHDEQRKEKYELMLKDPGNPNWEVALMVRTYRDQLVLNPLRQLSSRAARVQQITVCVRKRPMSQQEVNAKSVDNISVPSRDTLIVHELRHRVDLTKVLEHHKFRFDCTFDEKCSNALVYDHTARPLIRTMFEGGNATCFAYGQTGSGKTHTMGGKFAGKKQDCSTGIYAMAARDVFAELATPKYHQLGANVICSYFEIYGNKVCDLLVKSKPVLSVLEDGSQQVVICGLTKVPVASETDVLGLIELGNRARTSGKTSVNMKSSRSHAVFQMGLIMPDQCEPCGKCSFVDLAGNERGSDTQSSSLQTRREGAEINKSLLSLKECIRALRRRSSHLPFRGSKLTQVLRDSFIGGDQNKLCMIAMITPGMSSVENTLNTLRYADRVKELLTKEENSPDTECNKETSINNDEFEPSEESSCYFDTESDEPGGDHNSNSRQISNDIKCDSNLVINDADNDSDSDSDSDHNLDVDVDAETAKIVKQHEILFKCLDCFKDNFGDVLKGSSTAHTNNRRLSQLLLNVEPKLFQLQALVKQTHTMVTIYNLKRCAGSTQNEG
ncbi:kinesin-like protein Klp59C [Drosophila grimshawi]|uniref:kinesin-like protein Klp59C n=1 Tax=Drosophila grimshawi TaxID=7222 RepID=UPI001C931DA3|nr:kinesin-like protein Klp59C [Drosophila grimshawi]